MGEVSWPLHGLYRDTRTSASEQPFNEAERPLLADTGGP